MKTIILLMLLGGVAVVKNAAHVNDGEDELEDLISDLLERQDDRKHRDKAFDYGGHNLVKGNVVQTIPVLSKEWSLSVDIKPFKKLYGFTSIIHASHGNDLSSYGDRTPAIWFKHATNQLFICSAVNGNLRNVFIPTAPLALNVFTNVKVEQKAHGQSYLYSIYVGGKLVHSVVNNDAREFKNIKVYASDPWYPAAAAVILNYKFDYGYSLTKGKVLETIPVLSKTWSLSVDIRPVAKKNGWTNIIHASQGSDITSYGDRTPGIWFRGSSNKLHICSAVNGNTDYCYDPEPLQPNVFTNVKIEQKASGQSFVYSIYVGGKLVHQLENRNAKEFKNIKVYASDPWYPEASAVILNYKFENYFHLEKSKVLETIPVLSKAWSLSVDIKPLAIKSQVASIIHASHGGNYASYGDRNPGIWFSSGTSKLYICSAVSGNKDYCTSPVTPLPLNVFTNVKVEQKADGNSYIYSIYVGGKLVRSVVNNDAREFTNVKVYASDPWHVKASAVIRNYKFEHGQSNDDVDEEGDNTLLKEVFDYAYRAYASDFEE